MQAPLFLRPLEAGVRAALETGLRSPRGFPVRRCHIFLASAEGQTTTAIAKTLRCNDQTVRHAIDDCHQRGLEALNPTSSRPHTTHATFDANRLEQLRALLHQSPRAFGHTTRVWTLELAAKVWCAQGIPRDESVAKLSAPPWPSGGCAGNGPSTGSPVPIRRTNEKKTDATA